MPGQSTKLQRDDEDTDLGNPIHKTYQSGDLPETEPEEGENEPRDEAERQIGKKMPKDARRRKSGGQRSTQ
jgi:hypothetical protein